MAELAAKNGPAEQQRIATQLSEMYPHEVDPVIRGAIVRALGSFPSPVAMRILVQALKDKDADIRAASCQAIGKQGGPEAAATVRGVLAGDVDVDVRLAAVKGLGETKNREPATLAALGTALDDRNPAMQYQAVSALRRISPQDLGNDVQQWRAYVKGEPPVSAQPVSLSERMPNLFK